MAALSGMNAEMQAAGIARLFELARDRSEAGRISLAEGISDFFLSGHLQLNARESGLVFALIEEVMRHSSEKVRAILAERLGALPAAPRPVVKQLALEPIEVASSVLQNSLALADEDLIEVIGEKGARHAEAIARRQAISEAVADALVVTGDIKVMQLVAENLGAKLSPKAVHRLVESARLAEDLRPPLIRRPELPADLGAELYWWVPQELRRFLLKRFGFNAGQIETALETLIEDLLARHQLERHDDLAMNQIAEWLEAREAITPKLLIQVLRLAHYRLFNLLISRRAKLPLPLVDLAVAEAGGRSLAACCRAIGCDKPSFVSIFLLSRGARPGDQIVHPRELSFALAAFDKLNVTMAERLLDGWRRDPVGLVSRVNQPLPID